MFTVFYGKKGEAGFDLHESEDLLVVRKSSSIKKRRSRSIGTRGSRSIATEVRGGELVIEFPEVGVAVYKVPVTKRSRSLNERKIGLRSLPNVQFAGSVLVDPQCKEPVIYTENIFIKFTDKAKRNSCLRVLKSARLKVKREVQFAKNAYFVGAREGIGKDIFSIAAKLLKRKDVEYCHPELVRQRARRNTIFPQQWHLMKTTIGGQVIDAHANVADAHAVSKGTGVTIAVIDDGIDIDHPELNSEGKIKSPRDVTRDTDDPRPVTSSDVHGTAVAGVACASGISVACGVAPQACLMPIRLTSGLGSMDEAEAFRWAVDHGADVICCSWGPSDGNWEIDEDQRHFTSVEMPAHTRLAIDYAIERGRNGKGCVICFAAGNGRESVDHDGYAKHSKVMAVAACNDRGQRSVYSDFGKAIWCAFPSNDLASERFGNSSPLTPGIRTIDQVGGRGLTNKDYVDSFGGTSSSCPGVAGVAALMLSVNPNLTHKQVRHLLRRSCDKIAASEANYSSLGHSRFFGYGRVNALKAIELSAAGSTIPLLINGPVQKELPSFRTSSFEIAVSNSTLISGFAIHLRITHPDFSQIKLQLNPPSSHYEKPIDLPISKPFSSGSATFIFDESTIDEFWWLHGKPCDGLWSLKVKNSDTSRAGSLDFFDMQLSVPS